MFRTFHLESQADGGSNQEAAMFIRGRWELKGYGQQLPDGRFAPRARATYRADPHPDDHPLQWNEPTFATETEAAEWGLEAAKVWLEVREDRGE
jgi:hypothetical protein